MSRKNSPLGYEGEVGWVFQMATGYNATGVTTRKIHFTAPDGTKTAKTATATTTDAAGDFEWVVTSGFFTEGNWMAIVELDFSGTTVLFNKTPKYFTIGPDLRATP